MAQRKRPFPKILVHGRTIALVFLAIAVLLYIIVLVVPPAHQSSYSADPLTKTVKTAATSTSIAAAVPVIPTPAPFIVTHITTPKDVKAIYMTSWVSGTPALRSKLVTLMDDTEINSVVIDIKDYSGRISFETDNDVLQKTGASEKRIRDIKEFVGELHKKNIYVIGRISTFQDAYMVKQHPEWAVKRSSDGGVWKDYKGISWIDAGAKPYWDYIATIGHESYSLGFDELNFDYIRFPSDGNMVDIKFPFAGKETKALVLKGFFQYLHENFASSTPISADLFGMTTSNHDDLGIGQVLENALPYFDAVAPMVYPSHYPPTFLGYKNPATKPYEVVHYAMEQAVIRAKKESASTTVATLRPWLQDFNLGATYTPAMVRAQIQATYDTGLSGWMLWDAANHYTRAALMPYPDGIVPQMPSTVATSSATTTALR